MYILGISCFYHDAAAALLSDGVLLAAAEEERFTRKKHDSSFPIHSINFCLRQANIRAGDLDYVVFYEKPLLKFRRILSTTLEEFPRAGQVFQDAIVSELREKLWIKSEIAKQLRVSLDKILFVDHHLSHAASSFLCSPFEDAAIVTVDGVGEWTTTTLGHGHADWTGNRRTSIVLDSEIRFPHSLGLLYSTFTSFLGFEVNEGEYKVMGMAPYGEPRYLDLLQRVVRVNQDGSFQLNMEYFDFTRSTGRTYSRHFIDLFGQPRIKDSAFFTETSNPKRDHPDWSERNERQNQKFADIAASIQRCTEDILLKIAFESYRRTGLKRLCLAGGVALNSVANGRIVTELPFDEVFIQPASGDSGGALGAALYVYHVVLGHRRRFVLEHAYWGEEFSDSAMYSVLKEQNAKFEIMDDDVERTEYVVDALLDQKVVGWYQGRFEWGPRALGNRSILADPRRIQMKEIVNTKIKFREPFRPFAPVLPEHRVTEFFDIVEPKKCYPAQFMLLVQKFKGGKEHLLGAVNHFGTGRLQSIRDNINPRYSGIISKFGQATGIPVLLNTSFNLRGEPIVASPLDAYRTFQRSGIDLMVLGNFMVTKQ